MVENNTLPDHYNDIDKVYDEIIANIGSVPTIDNFQGKITVDILTLMFNLYDKYFSFT